MAATTANRSLEDLERCELLKLARLGQRFKENHCGRRPGYLRRFFEDLVLDMHAKGLPLTFAEFLFHLELAAARNQIHGEGDNPVVEVDRVDEVLVYLHPDKGKTEVPFTTLRNKLTVAKKILNH